MNKILLGGLLFISTLSAETIRDILGDETGKLERQFYSQGYKESEVKEAMIQLATDVRDGIIKLSPTHQYCIKNTPVSSFFGKSHLTTVCIAITKNLNKFVVQDAMIDTLSGKNLSKKSGKELFKKELFRSLKLTDRDNLLLTKVQVK